MRVDVCLMGETRVGRVLSVLRFSDLPNAIIEKPGERAPPRHREGSPAPDGGYPVADRGWLQAETQYPRKALTVLS